jgi:hypothetical protein
MQTFKPRPIKQVPGLFWNQFEAALDGATYFLTRQDWNGGPPVEQGLKAQGKLRWRVKPTI